MGSYFEFTLILYSCVLFSLLRQATAGVLTARLLQQPGGPQQSVCSGDGGYTGETDIINAAKPLPAPLRGEVGCVDKPLTVRNDLGQQVKGSNIYGPMENGFSTAQLQQFFSCNSMAGIPGGIDTFTAQLIAREYCNTENLQILGDCGGHAIPFHYHESMTCLYDQDLATGHSTRIGTMKDGNGLYGKFINGGVVPKDLDACGGRFGVTPDSNGEEVYYYVVADEPPFTVGCYGPANLTECRALYQECSDGNIMDITIGNVGQFKYNIDCPCYENIEGKVTNVEGEEPVDLLGAIPDISLSTTPSDYVSIVTFGVSMIIFQMAQIL